MLSISLKPRQIIAAFILGCAVYFIYTSANPSHGLIGLMAALATTIHMICISLRDATFRELMVHNRVGLADLAARCCMVVFDAVLLFGLIIGAGLRLPWPLFVSLVIGLSIVMPLVVYVMSRSCRAVRASQSGIVLDYWAPPVFLAVMAATLLSSKAVVFESGSQPFMHLLLLSSFFAFRRSGSTLSGTTRYAGVGVLLGTIVLIIWDFVALT
ncbi:MAG: hypothetical protein ABJL67_21870 [Sulfitobacter sp.]